MRCPHTQFTPGKRVLVILHDGTSYVDVFVGKAHGDRAVRFKVHGIVNVQHIRSIGIYKGGP